MTNLDALIAELEPYTASPLAYSKRLADHGIIETEIYSVANKSKIALAALDLLVAMLPLTSDSTGSASQGYSREGLEERIKRLCRDNALDETEFIKEPQVFVYHNLF